MSPSEINQKHGTLNYKCCHCDATENLYWWRGFTYALCRDPKCEQKAAAFFDREMEAAAYEEEYARDNGW